MEYGAAYRQNRARMVRGNPDRQVSTRATASRVQYKSPFHIAMADGAGKDCSRQAMIVYGDSRSPRVQRVGCSKRRRLNGSAMSVNDMDT
jgi:hypothetical protein